MKREDMRFGMKVILRLPSTRRAHLTDEEDCVPATVIQPFTSGLMDGCTDVRLSNGEQRMVHSSRIELPPSVAAVDPHVGSSSD